MIKRFSDATSRVSFRLVALVAILTIQVASGPACAAPSSVLPPQFSEEWVRGRFGGATPADVAVWNSKLEEARTCISRQTAEMKAKLIAAGRTPTALRPAGYGRLECDETIAIDRLASKFESWSSFTDAFLRAKLLFVGLKRGLALRAGNENFGDVIQMTEGGVANTTEQILRRMLQSGENPYPGLLRSEDLPIFNFLLGFEIQEIDRSNTSSLKKYIAERGWNAVVPRAADAGGATWLIIQHSDQDPSFQLEALEKLAGPKTMTSVGKPYALLFDRVHSNLFGEQEYGTQFACQDGKFVPKGLRSPETVDARRRELGLQSLQEYQADLERQVGKVCQNQPSALTAKAPSQ